MLLRCLLGSGAAHLPDSQYINFTPRNCHMVLNDFYRRLLKDQGMLLLRNSCVYWKNRVETMCGDGDKIARMSESELQLLLRQQQRGADRTAVALKEIQRNIKSE